MTNDSNTPLDDATDAAPSDQALTARRRRRWPWIVLGLLVAYVAIAIPVGLNHEVSESVVASVPLDDLWSYASDSTQATEWSVFFDHISPAGDIPDGEIGSLRISYRREDESGIRWDETTLSTDPMKHRQIRTFNLKNFKTPGAGLTEYTVNQHYTEMGDESSQLTFATTMRWPESHAGKAFFPFAVPAFIMLGAPETERIFKTNLENIAAAAEAEYRGHAYDRPHPYEPVNDQDKDT